MQVIFMQYESFCNIDINSDAVCNIMQYVLFIIDF